METQTSTVEASKTPGAAAPAAPAAPAKEPSLMERVASFKEPVKPETPPAPTELMTPKDIEAIKDPILKAKAEATYKSFQSDYTRKTQELAEERRKLEEEKKALEVKASQANQRPVWTAEKIQKELLSDPNFVAEAQRLAATNPTPNNPKSSGLSDEQWSALTAEEKAKFNLMEQKLAQLEQQNLNSQKQAQQAFIQQQHQELKSKFANYNSDYVDTTVRNIVEGKAQIGLEHIWKAIDYESAVERAYKLGLQDASTKVKDKIGSMSFEGGQVNGSKSALEPEKNESGPSFFRRLAIARLAEVKANTR